MKQFFALAFTLALTVTASLGQQINTKWCATDEHELEMQQQYPEQYARRLELENQVQALVQSGAAQRMSQTVRMIPVVVHVLDEDGIGISKAQIESGIAALNLYFRKRNADTINIRPLFQGFAADLELEFRLAKIDPNGKCTEGIVRVATPLTNSANPRNSVKAVSYWPSDKYLNVWLVNSIYESNPTPGQYVAGYAQFPSSGAANTYGFVCRHDSWGGVGTAAGKGNWTAAHEIGHCLNLYHTFGLTSGQQGCGGDCSTTGDMVCDTPPAQFATFTPGCNNTLNNCSNDTQGPSPFTSDVINQTENFMGYDQCKLMFTTGQKNRVLASFATYPFLQNLTSANNAIATGTNDGYVAVPCAPIASFKVNNARICAGTPVSFTDVSYNAVVDPTWNWNWSFPGASVPTSNVQNPTVTYPNPGIYSATLVVTNSSGTDSVTKTSIVKVIPVTGGEVAPFSEGFENPTFPVSGGGMAKDWEIQNTSSSGWSRSTATGYNSTASVRINNLTITPGTRNSLISPTIDMSNMQTVSLRFDLAYALRNTSNADKLYVYTSTNCGLSWQLKYTKSGAALSTNGGIAQTNFIPTDSTKWRNEIVTLGGLAGQSNVLVKLEVESNAGNNLFIDNLQITGTVLSTNEELNGQSVSLYPNPVVDETTINFYLKSASKVNMVVSDVLGRTVASKLTTLLNAGNQQLALGKEVSALPAGVYLLQLQQEKQVVTLRFVKR